MIVVDASVVATALADDGADGRRARERLRGERLIAPHLIDVEVLSAWRRLVAARQLDPTRAELAISDLAELRIDRADHVPLLTRCWELRANVTPYDALYIALAERAGAPLLTADAKLVLAPATTCQFELLT